MFSFSCCILSAAPQADEAGPPEDTTATLPQATRPRVRIVAVKEAAFSLRLRANGTLVARQQAVIKSASGGEIAPLVEARPSRPRAARSPAAPMLRAKRWASYS